MADKITSGFLKDLFDRQEKVHSVVENVIDEYMVLMAHIYKIPTPVIILSFGEIDSEGVEIEIEDKSDKFGYSNVLMPIEFLTEKGRIEYTRKIEIQRT
jgi:hypothetical protein